METVKIVVVEETEDVKIQVQNLSAPGDGTGGATNLSIGARTATTLTLVSDTGTDATLPAASATEAGLMTAAAVMALEGKADAVHSHAAAVASGAEGFMTGADKAKLDGVAAGATAAGATGDAFATSHLSAFAHGDIATAVQPARTITAGTGLSGGGDLSANRTISLANTAVTAGSYTAADITVDAQGRITAAANGTGSGIADGATLLTGLTFPAAGLRLLDTDASHGLSLSAGSNLTANRTLTLTTGDASRTLTLTADASVGGTNTGDQSAQAIATAIDADSTAEATLASALGAAFDAAGTAASAVSAHAGAADPHTGYALESALGTAAYASAGDFDPAGSAAAITLAGLGGVATSDARLSDARAPTAHDQAWSTITGTPTTRAGYGITDAAPNDLALIQGSRKFNTPGIVQGDFVTSQAIVAGAAGWYQITDALATLASTPNCGCISWNAATKLWEVASGVVGDMYVLVAGNVRVTSTGSRQVQLGAAVQNSMANGNSRVLGQQGTSSTTNVVYGGAQVIKLAAGQTLGMQIYVSAADTYMVYNGSSATNFAVIPLVLSYVAP